MGGVIGRIHSTESFGTLDGPGVRYVLFLQGCALRCLYCHNPDTWAMGEGTLADSQDVMADILKYRNFIKTGGVTLSGGEPLLQAAFVEDLCKRCAAHGVHTALDTAGTVPLGIAARAIDAADLILLDIKALDDELCKRLTGRGNAQTLRTLEYCQRIAKPVWARHVLVPGYTLDTGHLGALADYLKRFDCVETVELLAFHKMGEYKWEQLRLRYELGGTLPPTRGELAQARAIFEARGLNCLMRE